MKYLLATEQAEVLLPLLPPPPAPALQHLSTNTLAGNWSKDLACPTVRFLLDNLSARSVPGSRITKQVGARGTGAHQPLKSSHCWAGRATQLYQSSPETGQQSAPKLSRYSCIEEISRSCKTCSRSWANILVINPYWVPYYCSYTATISWNSLFQGGSKMPKLHSSDRPLNYRHKLYRGRA